MALSAFADSGTREEWPSHQPAALAYIFAAVPHGEPYENIIVHSMRAEVCEARRTLISRVLPMRSCAAAQSNLSMARRLMPQDLMLEFIRLSRFQAVASARYLAEVVGKAHARQMDASTRK
jgi:hypothetical protein